MRSQASQEREQGVARKTTTRDSVVVLLFCIYVDIQRGARKTPTFEKDGIKKTV